MDYLANKIANLPAHVQSEVHQVLNEDGFGEALNVIAKYEKAVNEQRKDNELKK